MNPAMLVATRSFTFTDEYGRRQQVTKGITYCAPSCEDVRRFPDAFALPTASVLGHLARSAAPTRSRPSRAPLEEVRVGAMPRAKVWMTYHVRGRLEELLSRYSWPEFGGFLYGHQAGPDDLVVTDAMEVEGTPRTRSSVALDMDLAPRCMGLDGIVGDWHFHPHGIGLASQADARVWHLKRDRLALPAYLGLIYTRESDGFGHRCKPWVTHSDGDQVACSPAEMRSEAVGA